MSHFSLAVLSQTERGEGVSDILHKFSRDNLCDIKDLTEKITLEWNKGENKLEKIDKSIYSSILEYAYNYYGCSKSIFEEKNILGHYCNLYGKFEHYCVGGRYDDFLSYKREYAIFSYNTVVARIKEVDFDYDYKKYTNLLRVWDVYMGKIKPVTADELHMVGAKIYGDKQELKDLYKSRENFARILSLSVPDAVITEDGEWFAYYDDIEATGDFNVITYHRIMKSWKENFYNRFIKNINQNCFITIVDCHD